MSTLRTFYRLNLFLLAYANLTNSSERLSFALLLFSSSVCFFNIDLFIYFQMPRSVRFDNASFAKNVIVCRKRKRKKIEKSDSPVLPLGLISLESYQDRFRSKTSAFAYAVDAVNESFARIIDVLIGRARFDSLGRLFLFFSFFLFLSFFFTAR